MKKKESPSFRLWFYLAALLVVAASITAFSLKPSDEKPSGFPLKTYDRISSGFGLRTNPATNTGKMHTGIDFSAPKGTPIYATASGTVTMAADNNSWGKMVVIRHGKTYETTYSHMDNIVVNQGTWIDKGAQIGTVGTTGLSTGSHLHYEVVKDGEKLDPANFLKNE